MAEAVVGERTSPPTRFYCHMCNLEINIFNDDYTCPLCSGGFIEELPPQAPTGDGGSSTGASASSSTSGSHSSIDPPSDSPSVRINDLVATFLMSRSGLAPMLGNLGGPQELEISIDADIVGGSGGGETSSGSGGSRGNNVNRRSVIGGGGGSLGNTGVGRQRQANFHRLDNVFWEFLNTLSGGEDGVGNSQMFFMGNPGDYAWGREGIDTVVTQLLNHMDTSGPPPLPKEKIAEIPTVEITEIEVEQKLKCSVCWEDFKLQEAVRKLPCLHLYHENCIVPWLDLHGTCPICRKSLQIEPSTSCSMHNGAASTSGRSNQSAPTATVSVTVTTSQPGTSAAAGRTSTTTLSQPQPMDTSSSAAPPPQAPTAPQAAQGSSPPGRSSHSLFAFDDGNVEYDFD